MNKPNVAAAWGIIIQREDRKESRVAFIAALIMERCKCPDAHPLTQTPAASARQAELFAAELVRLAEAIKREAEAACSYERTPAQEKRGEANKARFVELAEALGFEASTGGDPRGACAYLIDPAQRKGDGWGDGWAVYA